ncbi:MAG: DUF1631 family protein [Xanthomonadales bacterium]|nr:DUF1631 family protein [Xanthomonadales bacterium]
MIDPGSLADPEAPPRRLIDLLAEAALGWCEDADRERRILARIEAAVDAVVRDFDEDLAVFARELESFRAFFAAEERRAEAAATRQLAAVRGRERLRAARARVSERIARLVGEADLPPRLRHLLFGPWAHYLVLLFLREGEDSAALREGFELAARLLAAASGEAPERLRGELPRIEAQLRHGLHAAAVHDHEIEALLAWLRGLAGLAPPTPLETSPPQAAAPLAPPFRSETQADTAAAAPDPATPSTALELGSWWLFREGERERRGRLVWQSPLDGRLLFLHQRGGVLAELEAASFAQACREGRVHPLPRAGSAIERALRQCEQRLGGAGAGARA